MWWKASKVGISMEHRTSARTGRRILHSAATIVIVASKGTVVTDSMPAERLSGWALLCYSPRVLVPSE